MPMLTTKHLSAIMPYCPNDKLEQYAVCLTSAMLESSITTVTRAAAFLAQIAHETGDLRWLEEIADGSTYEGRKDLGNVRPGDGLRYKGRGPFMLTGRANYREYGAALDLPLEEQPELAARPEHGFRIAGLYWTRHHLNERADKLDSEGITRAINGGLNNYINRLAYYHKALEVLGRTAKIVEVLI